MRDGRTNFRALQFHRAAILLLLIAFYAHQSFAQAVPYARTVAKSPEEVRAALQEMQVYAGQKLPIVDGFVAVNDRSLENFERAYYQFSIDLIPGPAGGTIIRVTAKITAWYADRDPAKSGYQVLPSNGRLELDLLDRLSEKFSGNSSSARPSAPMPRPKLDLRTNTPGIALPRSVEDTGNSGSSSEAGAPLAGNDELVALRVKRAAEEKRLQELNTELQNLQDIQRSQSHPGNLVVIKKTGTPVFMHPAASSKILFAAAADDEFEFLDAQNEWIHVQISGASRGYLRSGNVDLPPAIGARLHVTEENKSATAHETFHITRQETGGFPGTWESLNGKQVRILTVQPVSPIPKQSGPAAKSDFAISLFQKFAADTPESSAEPAGVVIIFDSADGGIAAAPLVAIRQLVAKNISRDAFLKECYFEPRESFQPAQRP